MLVAFLSSLEKCFGGEVEKQMIDLIMGTYIPYSFRI